MILELVGGYLLIGASVASISIYKETFRQVLTWGPKGYRVSLFDICSDGFLFGLTWPVAVPALLAAYQARKQVTSGQKELESEIEYEQAVKFIKELD